MILSAQAVTKRYGAAPGYEAVRDASLELHEGEFVAIVGRSGSGKSTLLALLGALTKPTEGKLLLDGIDIWALAETERASFRCRDVGFIFQFPSLLSNLSATDNVALPALLGGTLDPPAAYARARHLLARLGLADRAEAYPDSMSGGEQRRAVIARALMNSPRLLLADEPTSDLDEDTENDIIDLLAQLQRTESFGLALVTHNLELAKRARCTYEMRHGALASADLPDIVVTPEASAAPLRSGGDYGRPRADALDARGRACSPGRKFLARHANFSARRNHHLCRDHAHRCRDRRDISEFRCGSGGHGSRHCSTWHSTAFGATSSRSRTWATGITS